jgi:mRNA interferase RelE/StbE
MTYSLIVEKSVLKRLKKIPPKFALKLVFRMLELNNGHPSDAKALTGDWQRYWRTRVGDYRIIYSIDDDVIIVAVVGHRKDVYDNP